MKRIKITKDGALFIKEKCRFCPYTEWDNDIKCGDWCALFGEPRDLPGESDWITLHLCHQVWTCPKKDFIDEREGEDHAENK